MDAREEQELNQIALQLDTRPHNGKVTQLYRVRTVLERGGWMTLGEISRATFHVFGKIDTECAVSARIRSLPHELRRRGGHGQLFEYRIT